MLLVSRASSGNVAQREMKWSMAVAAACLLTVPVVALDGQPGLHDPSTVITENGKYVVYATGGGLPMSISDRYKNSPLTAAGNICLLVASVRLVTTISVA
jgi:hypothetical protein